MRGGITRSGAALVSALLLGLAAPLRGGEQTRKTMLEIFEALRFVLPLSLDDDRFQDPELRSKILEALTTLAENGARLEAHGQQREAPFTFLSRSLARDTRDIQTRYADGQFAEARFLLHEVTEDCVACHSRLPADRKSRLAERFVDREQIAALPLDERVRLEMATRQFDRALATYEALFASPDTSPTDLDLMGHFDGYLELCIRIRQDRKRPARVLEKFAERDDLSRSLRANVENWIASLTAIRQLGTRGSELQRAQALLRETGNVAQFPNERRALVHYIAASALLHRYVAAQPEERAQLAEAYYLLGVIESRIGRSFWLSQTEFFLETSIRLAPDEPFAEEAYALLEEFTVLGYTGSAGSRVPTDVRERLKELRELIDRS